MEQKAASRPVVHRTLTMQNVSTGEWMAVCSCGWDGDDLPDRYDADMQGVLHGTPANADQVPDA